MTLFLSTYINKIDKKGRVSVPASFRAALPEQKFSGVIAFASHTAPAVECCTYNRMEKMSQSLDTLDLFSQARDDLAGFLFADAHPLSFDQEGRVILPEILLKHAKIDGDVAFVGRGPTFQIWAPDAFHQHQETLRHRLKEKGATLKLPMNSEA